MTTPNNTVAGLAEKWRADANFYRRAGEGDKSVAYERCADELEAALASPAPSASDREELEKLRELCDCAYQLAGVHDAPEAWLDALSDAATGTPWAEWRVQGDLAETLLPYTPSAPVGVDEADIDAMRDVYLSSRQREAYDRILTAALAGKEGA